LVGAGPPVIPDHTLLRLIGRGSYGVVWLARNVMGTYRAVKVVYRATFDDERPYEREFTGIRKFEPISRSHECQVQILHIGRNDQEGYFFYVMELADDAGQVRSAQCGARSCDSRSSEPPTNIQHQDSVIQPECYVPRSLQYEIETRGRLPFAECLRISLALAGALKHLHGHGLVHRDIKPSNIIFVNGIPKLADIGLVTESEATITYVGAQGFMAPEGPGRPRGDLYSLGKVIYEMCTGRDRMDFPALPAGFGDWQDRVKVNELLAVSLKACEPDPAKRHASAETLLAELVMVQADKSVRRLRMLERGRRWAVAVVGLAVLAVAAAWLLQHETRARERTRRLEVLVREAQMARLGERRLMGWSSNALQRLTEAGRVRLDDDLRAQAVATLAGLDSHVARIFPTNEARYLAFDSQGRRLLKDAGVGGHVQLCDLQKGVFKTFASTNSGPVWFASGGSPRQLVYNGRGAFQLLNPEDGTSWQEFRLPDEGAAEENLELQALAVSADASLYAAAVHNFTSQQQAYVAVWETATGKLVARATEACEALAFSPDNSCLATGNDEGRVRIRTLPAWGDVCSFRQDRTGIRCLAFGPDASQSSDVTNRYPWVVAAGNAGGTINVYQVAERRLKVICRGSHYDVYAVAFGPDGMTLASSGRGEVRLWDLGTGRNLLTIPGWDFAVALGFSPDGIKLAVGTLSRFSPGAIGVLEVEPGRGVTLLRGLSSQSSKVEFSHDGQRLAALSHNWEVGLWNLASNRMERLFDAPRSLVADNAALAFSQDDSQLAFATLPTRACGILRAGGGCGPGACRRDSRSSSVSIPRGGFCSFSGTGHGNRTCECAGCVICSRLTTKSRWPSSLSSRGESSTRYFREGEIFLS
jgi:WD40 repeat protein